MLMRLPVRNQQLQYILQQTNRITMGDRMLTKEELIEIINYFAQTKEVQMYMKYTRMLNERSRLQEKSHEGSQESAE
jgi:hypothetical protein